MNSTNKEKWIALIEVIGFVILAFGVKRALDPVIWKYAGPISLIATLLILSFYMHFRGLRWSQMGLVPLPGWKAKLMVIPKTLFTGAAFIIVVATILLGSKVLGLEFMDETPAGVEDRWGNVKGNLPMYLLWLVIVWTAAAFGEEMFFRGFLITRLQAAFKGWRLASVLAVLLSALIFGYGHMYYQGLRGMIVTGAIALVFGTMFLLFKRNLWPIILWHGVFDTLTFTALYLDWDA